MKTPIDGKSEARRGLLETLPWLVLLSIFLTSMLLSVKSLGILSSGVAGEAGALPFPVESSTTSTDRIFTDRAEVVTTFFSGKAEPSRMREFVKVIELNLANPYIGRVHLLAEDSDPRSAMVEHGDMGTNAALQQLVREKLVVTMVSKQLTYSELFEYANVNASGRIAIVTNSDIFFDESLGYLGGFERGGGGGGPATNPTTSDGDPILRLDTQRTNTRTPQQLLPTAYAMSRSTAGSVCKQLRQGARESFYRADGDYSAGKRSCRASYFGSHDAFLFRSPVAPSIIEHTKFYQNRNGAENAVIYQFAVAGYNVRNPCFVINAWHVHCSRKTHSWKLVSRGDPMYGNVKQKRGKISPPGMPWNKACKYDSFLPEIEEGVGVVAWKEGDPRRVKLELPGTKCPKPKSNKKGPYIGVVWGAGCHFTQSDTCGFA